jgi:sensor domain CHASE-containing protein
MKVFKMDNLETLRFEIKNKIKYIEDRLLGSQNSDNQVIDKIPQYLDEISRLKQENLDLKMAQKQLNESHYEDLEKVEGLVVELSKLLEGNDA